MAPSGHEQISLDFKIAFQVTHNGFGIIKSCKMIDEPSVTTNLPKTGRKESLEAYCPAARIAFRQRLAIS